MSDIKLFEGMIKTIPTDGSRTGSAIVYVYGAADQDPILDEMFSRRTDLKLRWSHGTTVDDIIGKITAVRFLADRVEVDFKLFDTPEATKVYEGMLTGQVTEFSVGFAFEESDVYKAKDDRWHVRRAELVEVSAVAAGANRETMLVSIKSLDEKAGRTLSAKNEAALRTALGNIAAALQDAEGVLGALTGSQAPQTASYESMVKAWLDAEVGVWLVAEQYYQGAKDWLEAEEAYRKAADGEPRDWNQINAELDQLAEWLDVKRVNQDLAGIETGIDEGSWVKASPPAPKDLPRDINRELDLLASEFVA